MKINDIIAEAGILGSIGRGLAGAATGAIRMLDKAGGGDGTNVGTAAQQAAYANKIQQTQYAKARAGVPAAAFEEFNNALKQNKINLQDPQSYDPASITDYLKSFTENYFAAGDRYHNANQEKTIKVGVLQALNQIPLPRTINNISVQDYLEKANTVRNSIINQVDKMMATQQAAQPATQDSTVGQSGSAQQPAGALPADVTVVSSSPVVLRYRNQDFALTDSDRWVRFGSNKLASPEMEAYLTRQLQKL
jgi:hypothetical protein